MSRPRAPRTGSPNERRESLVAAGLSLIGEVALEEVDALAVARRAGVSKALVYYYFPTHRDLQVAVVQAAADGLLRAIDTDPQMAAADRLAAALDAGIAYIEAQPQAYRALSRGAAFSPQLMEVFEYARSGVVDALARGMGIADPSPAQRLCLRSWLALVEEAVLHWIVTGAPVSRAELVAYCRDVALYIVANPLAAPVAAAAAH
ncbi:TetR/AcrR family transcriptional regulator [Acidiferrimicrobium sp. IK]|uniref:TetR/AcrR family transcriptional regulator n=1 Tax=Acidiferrimicrobium sp. IK TaxID=2871700 RepID=UPI0021CAEA28|nr:TetR/AcrR family transcriptional regulator [Acidiferrimicrobium sp. IK]MCU4185529.1 TetR/AcrR family transcriptional regulator [Acidiferrimicrobium sp. IK]